MIIFISHEHFDWLVIIPELKDGEVKSPQHKLLPVRGDMSNSFFLRGFAPDGQ
jgi:hypothetical protein